MSTLSRLSTSLALGAALLVHGAASAQDSYPSKPIRFVVPVTAGGGTDVTARSFSQAMSTAMKQPIVVDNKPGAGGTMGTEDVARAKPDGYTVLVMNEGFTINPSLFKVSYDPQKDLIPVALLATTPNVLAAHPSLPANNVKELIALAKAKPGHFTIGVSAGQMSHAASAIFAQAAGIDLMIIPYKGNSQIVTDLLGGQVMMSFGSAPNSAPLIKTGKLKGLGHGGPESLPLLPGVAPIAQSMPGFEAVSWVGLFVPAGTPQPIVERLRTEALAAMRTPAVTERLEKEGSTPGTQVSQPQFAARIKQELAKWDAMAKKGALKLQE